MGKPSRDKGDRREREIKDLLPGAVRVNYAWQKGPDLKWYSRFWEVKAKADGWRLLHRWLKKDDVSGLLLKADRKPWLIVLEVDEFLDLMDEAKEVGQGLRYG